MYSTVLSMLTGYWEPPRRRCCCARRGTQLVLVGLLSTVMWAGLLALLLLWRKDIHSPIAPQPIATFCPHPLPPDHPIFCLILMSTVTQRPGSYPNPG